MMKITIYKNLYLIFIFAFVQIGWSQNAVSKKTLITYTAFIKDSNGNPIRNAKVFGNQGDVKTSTNMDGWFTIQVNLDSYLLIESEGFNSTTISSTSKIQDIILTQSPFLLGSGDFVSMGFKNVKKGLSVGNEDKISPDDILKNDNVTRFQDILDAYGAGIKSGTNLLGIGNALVIVDGLPRDPSSLIPEEIQDIYFLKDVNSTVLYGSQAKNGVILVKTKRGISNKKLMKMSVEKGINKPIGMPNYLNSKDYMTLYNEARINDGNAPTYDPSLIAIYDGSNPTQYPDVNYYGDEYLKPIYNTTRFVGEFSGGNNIATYYANVGWEHQDVLYKANNGVNNGSNQLRVRGNVDFKINEHIKSYIDAAFIFNTNTGLRSNYFTMASTYRPNDYIPLIAISSLEDPTIADPLVHVNNNYILGGNSLITNNSYGKNVYGELNFAGYSKDYQNKMQFNIGIIYDLEQITKGLTIRGNVSFDNIGAFSESVQNTYALYEPTWKNSSDTISSLKTINSDTKTGVLTLSSGSIAETIGANFILNYDNTFNTEHHLSSSLIGFYSSAIIDGSNQLNKNSHIGLNVAYDYKKCYLIDFSGAMINSVKLAPGHKLSFSPSLGLGWLLSNADFWKTNKAINYLKFKASAGILQTDAAFGYDLYREIFGGQSYFTTGDVGGYSFQSTYVSHSANPNLGMEKMKNINIGFETAILNKSFFINASYFVTNYSDQIIQKLSDYSALYGTEIPYENFNETKYSGMDISLNYKKNWEKLSITCGLNLLYSTSEYIKRAEINSNDYQNFVGHSTDTYWGLKNLGFFATDAEAAAANQRFGTVKKGDIKYADLDGNGYIDANDRTAIGNSSPKLTTDINFSIAYKGLSLFISASARLDYDWMMSTTEAPNTYFWVDGTTKYSEIVLNRWTEATAATATYPRLTAETSKNNFQNSDFWMRNGNDLTLSRVQLNYTFPERIFKNLFISGLSTYLRGSNLLYFAEDARLRQVNPQLTNTRNFAIGLKINY